jgi:oligoendopeptidase F
MRAEADLFREKNIPLLTEEQKLSIEYDKIRGAQTVDWDGEEKTVPQLDLFLTSSDRTVRERAWKTSMKRWSQDRDTINSLWKRFLSLRLDIAKNADKPDYRAYKWQQSLRFDYTPADCLTFHDAIERAVVPVVRKLLEHHRKAMGVDMLRPWDIDIWAYVDPHNRPQLKPFKTEDQQVTTTRRIFDQVDTVLGKYFQQTVDEGRLDLMNRKNKGPGAYCASYNKIRKPFVFCNSVGTHDNVQTLLHESGHSFHVYESAGLSYQQDLAVPMEFAEVASMGMELLASPFFEKKYGGFYDPKDAGRALGEHLITALLFWPYMAVVDAFQHWIYENPQKAMDTNLCDGKWAELWDRFMPVIDWTGFEEYKKTGWHRKLHIHQVPFYYVEYGLAQLGAVQIWANSMKDHKKAVADYRAALALGGTRTLPELFKTAGAKFAFDYQTLKVNVDLMESTIDRLEKS